MNQKFDVTEEELNTSFTSIPLADPKKLSADQGLGSMVRDLYESGRKLVRAEFSLAKVETLTEVKKFATSSIFLIVAGVIAFYASISALITFPIILAIWLPVWVAFLIEFVVLILLTFLMLLIGFIVARKIRAPKKTINSIKNIKTAMPSNSKKY